MEYCYVIPKNDELMHYGVKGMHWGIRRYQPYFVHPRKGGKTGKVIGKANKAAAWKQKEIVRRSADYDREIEGYDRYIQGRKDKISKFSVKKGDHTKKIYRIQKKIGKAKTEKVIAQKLKNAEINKIKNMTPEQVGKAKVRKGMFVASKVLKSAAISGVSMAALSYAAELTKGSEIANIAANSKWTYGYNLRKDALNRLSKIPGTPNYVRFLGNQAGPRHLVAAMGAKIAKKQAMDDIKSAATAIALSEKLRATSRALADAGMSITLAGNVGVAKAGLSLITGSRYSNLTRQEKREIVNKYRRKRGERIGVLLHDSQ